MECMQGMGGKNKERSINQEGERSMIHNFSPYGEGSYLGGVNPNFPSNPKTLIFLSESVSPFFF